MTIKNTKKNISATINPKDVVVGISKNYENDSLPLRTDLNFDRNLIIKLEKQNQYDEQESGADIPSRVSQDLSDKIIIPIYDLVRKEHLQTYYYTKTEIDNKLGTKIRIVDALPQSSSQDSDYGNPSVIFFLFNDTNSDNENIYEQYVWDSTQNEYTKVKDIDIQLPDLLRIADIADNLTTNDSTKVLSAAQGTLLEKKGNKVSTWSATTNNTRYPSEKLVKDSLDEKISISNTVGLVKNDGTIDTNIKLNTTDVINNLTSTSTTKQLSAAQGKVLNDNKIDKTNIVNNLTTNDSTKVLSAAQGKVLKDILGQLETIQSETLSML